MVCKNTFIASLVGMLAVDSSKKLVRSGSKLALVSRRKLSNGSNTWSWQAVAAANGEGEGTAKKIGKGHLGTFQRHGGRHCGFPLIYS